MNHQRVTNLSLHPLLMLLLALAPCMLVTAAPMSQARAYEVPILVLADDEDPASVKGSSALFGDLLSDFDIALQRTGFRAIDARLLIADLGWPVGEERQPLRERLSVHKKIAEFGMAEGIRAAVSLRLTIMAWEQAGRNSVSLRVENQIFSYPGLQRVDIFSTPLDQFAIPSGCSGPCVAKEAKEEFPRIASSLATVLERRLSPLLNKSAASAESRLAEIAEDEPDYVPAFSPYTVTLRNFNRADTLTFIGVMVEEFPGYQNHDLISLDSSEAQYLYETSASRAKLLQWINILLNDMSLDEGDIAITFQGNDLTIEKSAPTGSGTSAE